MGLKEEIKKLIESGFKLELISSEMDIPIEQVRQWESELREEKSTRVQQTKPQTVSKSGKKSISNSNPFSKMQEMREKYEVLYEGAKTKKQDEQAEQLSAQDIEKIQKALVVIENQIAQLSQNPSKDEKREIANSIWKQISKIKQYSQMPSEENEKIATLINSQEMQELRRTFKWFNSNMFDIRNTTLIWFCKAINDRIDKAEKIEELEDLRAIITPEMERKNPVGIGGAKSRIERKISAIRQKNAVDRIRNNIPSSILEILTDLANGELDLQKADELIAEEARRRVESKPKTRFSLTEEQEKRQILIQLRTALMEKPDKYNIKNPLKTVTLLEQLCRGEQGEAIRTVGTNLIEGKRFEAAKILCNKFSNLDTQGQSIIYIRRLRENIKQAEIADMVLCGLNTRGTPEKENKYFDLIETGLKHENISPKSIILGKSKDGTRTITLADIWVGESIGVNR